MIDPTHKIPLALLIVLQVLWEAWQRLVDAPPGELVLHKHPRLTSRLLVGFKKLGVNKRSAHKSRR